MRIRPLVLAVALVGALTPSAEGILLRGKLVAMLDGARLRTRDAHHFIDEVVEAYVVTSCIVHVPQAETGYACLHTIRVSFALPTGATGPVPCEARYQTYPAGDTTADIVVWDTYEDLAGGCSVEIRRRIADRFGRAGRLRGTFRATVSPSSGQGGPDREMEGTFRTRLFGGTGE